jgi:hypothetical protein
VLSLAVTHERFEPIAWWSAKKIQCFSGIELSELPNGDPRDSRETPTPPALEQHLRITAAEASDHKWQDITHIVTRQADVSHNRPPLSHNTLG